jgi:hypothetical protein
MQTLNSQPDSMDWQVYRNDSTVLTLVLVDTNDVALDLTDWDFAGQVRQFPTNIEVLDSMNIVKNENILTIGLDTTDLDVMNYFDIQGVNDVTGTVSTILTGTIYVQEDVTRL